MPAASFPVRTRAQTAGGPALRCDIVAEMVAPFADRWEVAADEPLRQGGEASAPPPLDLLAAALVACLATQIRVFARHRALPLDRVGVAAEFRWRGLAQPGGLYAAQAEGIDIDIRIEAGVATATLVGLMHDALRACFVEAVLDRALPVRHRLHHRGACLELPGREAGADAAR